MSATRCRDPDNAESSASAVRGLDAELNSLVDYVPANELPALVAMLTAAEMKAKARYLTHAMASMSAAAAADDRVLGVKEAADRLGVSPDWIYRRSKKLPFVVRVGGKLGCSSRGIERFIQQGLSSKKRVDL